MEKILIIIPAYNEEANILKAFNKIKKFNTENNTTYDVIVINDCSTDSTLKICLENNIPVIPHNPPPTVTAKSTQIDGKPTEEPTTRG